MGLGGNQYYKYDDQTTLQKYIGYVSLMGLGEIVSGSLRIGTVIPGPFRSPTKSAVND
jgi:hypothetical protein